MKRLIGAALALSLLGATAASAQPMHGSFAPVDYRDHYRHRDGGDGAAVAAGIGFLALTAILASQPDRGDWDDRDGDWGDRDYGYRGYGYAAPGYGAPGYGAPGYAAPGYAAPYGGYRGW